MTRVRVIGVGTAYGDDRAGLEVAARLRSAPPPGCEVVSTARPGADLLELLGGADAVIVVDAVRSGAAPGSLYDRRLEDLPTIRGACSSHALGVGEAMALAGALGRRPRGRFLGIEAASGAPRFDAELHPAVAAAIAPIVDRARAWADYFRAAAR